MTRRFTALAAAFALVTATQACTQINASASADEFSTNSTYSKRTTSPATTDLVNTGARLTVYAVALLAIGALASGLSGQGK